MFKDMTLKSRARIAGRNSGGTQEKGHRQVIRIFIGYDPAKPSPSIPVRTARSGSARSRWNSSPSTEQPARLKELHTDGSNQFIYSRFLVPYLIGFNGSALFIDGDMIVRDDIAKLWELRDLTKAVQCVKHDYAQRTRKSI